MTHESWALARLYFDFMKDTKNTNSNKSFCSILRNSFRAAFAMYSRIPTFPVEWSAENRRFALCFFPLVGAVIGALAWGWYFACEWLGWTDGGTVFAAGAVAIPLLVTGGIHMDGYCDVHDALACMGDREKRLAVMKDSHIGAFAAIHLGLYLILQFVGWTQIKDAGTLVVCALGFVQSRAYSAYAAVSMPNARGEGSLMNFSAPAPKTVAKVMTVGYLILSCAGMAALGGISGVSATLGGLAVYIWYTIFSKRKFGGITGDLEGYFLQNCELAILWCAVLGGRICEVLGCI